MLLCTKIPLISDENLDKIHQDADIPNMGHHEAGTTALEFDGALDEPEDEDEAVEAIKVDESDEDSKPKHQKSTKKVCRLETSLLY